MSAPGGRPVVLVPFDRSSDSEAAIARVCRLMPDAELTVLTVWQPTDQAQDPDTSADTRSNAIVGTTDITDQDVALSVCSRR